MAKQKRFVCVLCKEKCAGYGNNPAPLKSRGRCCDKCNATLVIPTRLKYLFLREKILDKNDAKALKIFAKIGEIKKSPATPCPSNSKGAGKRVFVYKGKAGARRTNKSLKRGK